MVLINLKAVPFIIFLFWSQGIENWFKPAQRVGRELLLEFREVLWERRKGGGIRLQEPRQVRRWPGCCLCLPSVSLSLSSRFLPLFAFLSFLVLLCLVFFVSLVSSRSVSSFVCALSPLSWHLEVCTFVYSLFSPDQLLLNPILYDIDVHGARSPYSGSVGFHTLWQINFFCISLCRFVR